MLATRNPHKVQELEQLLEELDIAVHRLDKFPAAPEVVEDGTTCEANAVKKALAIARFTGLPAVADDTGLEVEALGGRPGVFTARYAGENATYEDNWRKLLRELECVPQEQRRARFITVAAIAVPNGRVETARGVLEGRISEQPAGASGFGYDPVFWVPELGKTLAELSPKQKNQVSHRAKAFRQAKELLKTM